MATKTLQNDIYWLLMQLAVRARHSFARVAEKQYGLTWIQLHTLCLLSADRPLPMHELSCSMACDASNITGIIDRLSAQGYTMRQDDPHDRRIKLVTLTPKGVSTRDHILANIHRIAPEAIEDLPSQERELLQRLLAKLLLPVR